jgi:hypothetical protein
MSLPPYFEHQSLLFGVLILRQQWMAWRRDASTINHAYCADVEVEPAVSTWQFALLVPQRG